MKVASITAAAINQGLKEGVQSRGAATGFGDGRGFDLSLSAIVLIAIYFGAR
jgi:hypothetical protein